MRLRIYILLLLLIASLGHLNAQKSRSKVAQSNAELLQQARAAREKNPQYAIQLVEQVLRSFNSKKRESYSRKLAKEEVKASSNEQAEAYVLLGEIYAQINQNELALQRYQQAMDKWTGSEKGQLELNYEMGKLFLKLGDDSKAELQFEICEQAKQYPALRSLCAEGLADVQLLRGNASESISQLKEIKENYVLDSLSTARINAKKSRGYIEIGDYDSANVYLDNSLNTLPESLLKEEEIVEITLAKDEFYSDYNYTIEEKAEKTITNNARTGKSTVNQLKVRDNLKVASLYEEKNDLTRAAEFINISKRYIDDNTDAAVVAEVFKKSAEINRNKGLLDAALADVEQYSKAKEQAIQNLEKELKQQVDIVKGQQQIDLISKDFDIESKEEELLGAQLRTQKIISGFLGVLLLSALVFFYFLNKNVKACV